MNDIEEIMDSGKLYNVAELTSADPLYHQYLQQMDLYNSLGHTDMEKTKGQSILKNLFAEIGENSYIQPPYHAMWGGRHVHLGKNVYINFNYVTILPGVHIGDNAVIGAGSVVARDIPPDVVAFGNPAKARRKITPDDDVFYRHGKLISENMA